ncbi:GLUCOKINASE (GLUCOSE KINASE) [Mycoplasmopsis pulmonis]|uniref:GLUCOKINASE (GLUCOSE KINASE) n=1 Tax=Mycoplasmopsis pulmonis (strain UAB CTIP) TaxID=272635 RepID=Q98QY2_MYCPU|nr:ROK family protein [Mycoplasmopsis pulmonis]MDZ7293191.1 ROK family protein [Mycoplasmopsis pulmonis]CAC13401.1 GLUCOKINASE (GLUCOSE KINASE) [Mycoplasmopsis pulmonis]VEU67989.1 N-acetyl-D-glucosamine kinase [Mycoplasmopsis pulmonis]
MKIIAIDIGGTNTRVALYDESLKKLDYKKITSHPRNYEETMNQVVEFINGHQGVEAIGISAPGPADYQKGVFFNLPNLPGWRNFHFIDFLKQKTNVKNIKAQNDANLMALAHHYHFKRTKDDVTQFFTVSTGIGAGLIIENKIFAGSKGFGQEIANLPAAWNKESGFGYGQGSIELYASGKGLSLRSNMKAQELLSKYNYEDNKIIEEAIESLANLIAISAAFVNPNLIVFDGSVARYNKWYIMKAIEISRKRMFESQWNSLEFKFSELDDDAALIGAFHLVTKNNS